MAAIIVGIGAVIYEKFGRRPALLTYRLVRPARIKRKEKQSQARRDKAIQAHYEQSGKGSAALAAQSIHPPAYTESKREIEKILDRHEASGVVMYLIWWKGQPREFAEWVPRDVLLQLGYEKEIAAYQAV